MQRTRECVRESLAEKHHEFRERLGERFDAFVDELAQVHHDYTLKYAALPEVKPGTLDGNSHEIRRLDTEETLKWILIKIKYGLDTLDGTPIVLDWSKPFDKIYTDFSRQFFELRELRKSLGQ